jgi:sugar/nucleoside kinase (ribokinase family)
MNDMKDAGVTHNLNETSLAEGITGKCLIMVTEDAERNMNTFFRITQTYSNVDVNEAAIIDSKYLYIE